jgi:hypothetical protein
MTTSGCIGIGAWYRSWDGGGRRIRVSVYYHHRRVAFRRIRAKTHWTNHLLKCLRYPNAGTYLTTVRGSGWTSRFGNFKTRVTIDQD